MPVIKVWVLSSSLFIRVCSIGTSTRMMCVVRFPMPLLICCWPLEQHTRFARGRERESDTESWGEKAEQVWKNRHQQQLRGSHWKNGLRPRPPPFYYLPGPLKARPQLLPAIKRPRLAGARAPESNRRERGQEIKKANTHAHHHHELPYNVS